MKLEPSHPNFDLCPLKSDKDLERIVRVTRGHTKADFAKCLKWLASRYRDAITIHLVMDNLNTHSQNALVETFGPVEGRRIWARFTVHYTPKHGSWLNQAEIAIGVMVRCALGTRRFSTLEAVRDTVTKFWKVRRAERWKIDRRFSVKKAKRWLKTFGS